MSEPPAVGAGRDGHVPNPRQSPTSSTWAAREQDDDDQEEEEDDGSREKMNAWDKTSTDSSMACSATKADRVATASVDSHSRRANITSNEATRADHPLSTRLPPSHVPPTLIHLLGGARQDRDFGGQLLWGMDRLRLQLPHKAEQPNPLPWFGASPADVLTCLSVSPIGPASAGSPGSASKNVKVVLEGGYAHLNLSDIQDAILQVEGVVAASGIADGLSAAPVVAQGEVVSRSSHDQDASSHRSSAGSASDPFRVVVTDETGTLKPKSVFAMLRLILQARLKVTNRIVNDEWSIDGPQLMRALQQAAQPPVMIGGLDDQLRNLPMEPTRLNIELVRIRGEQGNEIRATDTNTNLFLTDLQLLSRFKASIDGNPDPESRFMKHWVPLSIKDPLLLQIVLYTAVCFLKETGRVPKMLVWAYKGVVHRMLNEHLSSTRTQTGDAAIMGAAQMVMDSWYWGTTEELRAHMAGLKTMIRMRGGLQDLGMGGFLAKTVLIHDIAIAIAHDIEPDIYGQGEFEFRDDFMVPYQTAFNSPFLSGWPHFVDPGSALKLHRSSAQILDDVRLIIQTVQSLPPSPTAQDLQNVTDAALWALNRLDRMPENIPLYEEEEATGHPADEGDDCMWETTGYEGAGTSPASSSDYDTSSPRSHDAASSNGSPPAPVEESASARLARTKNDAMYRCIRVTASVYYRAIIARVPTTEILGETDFLKLWELVWEVTVPFWKTAVGVFIWVMAAAVPSCHNSPPARFIKTLSVVGWMTIGLENWHVAINAANTALSLQRWLRGGHAQQGGMVYERGPLGGEIVVEKHGFILREASIPEVVANVRCNDDHELIE
ncbi:transcriptional regulator family: Fungal Specific TF [Trichoderma harzianum]|nr:transcriptional regulator family: Fungal Specific TF [Trichoderma harzianum]